MKNQILLASFALVIVTCSFSGKTRAYKYDGKWSETWGVGQKTDVTYHDQYTIRRGASSESDQITCQSSGHYRFIDIKFEADSLTFKIINTSGNDTLPYYLRIDKKGKKMKGIAYSVRNERTIIEWKRVK